MHGACLACGDDAYLITARTDTGKTTTILRTLDSQPSFDFLSDDLTIISPDGRVLPYPKPLTISRHTLVAVKTPLLSRKERTGLFFQSRLHSALGATLWSATDEVRYAGWPRQTRSSNGLCRHRSFRSNDWCLR